MISRSPKVKWAEVTSTLSQGFHWFPLGRFLGIPFHRIDHRVLKHQSSTKPLCWNHSAGKKPVTYFASWSNCLPSNFQGSGVLRLWDVWFQPSYDRPGWPPEHLEGPWVDQPHLGADVLFLLASFHTFPGKKYHTDSQSHKKEGQTYNTWPNTTYVTSLCHTLLIFVSRCWPLT